MIERTYRVNDVIKSDFLRLPLTLLANPKYKAMSLEAKFIYSLLLNRMTLSQRNDWINEDNEVYLIYTREEAASTLNISYKRSIAAFKELIRNGLLYEQRQGLGAPNLLYVLKAELTDEDAAAFGETFSGNESETDAKEPETPANTQMCQNGISRHAETAHQELPKSPIRNCQIGTSRTAGKADQDMPKPHTRKTESKKIESSYIENSQPIHLQADTGKRTVPSAAADEPTDDETILSEILDQCELELFSDGVRRMLVQAVERLYYSDSLRIGSARLPQEKVRSYLKLLDGETLLSVVEAIKANEERITNPMAYIMSTIINAVCERESELILSLPADYIKSEDLYAPADHGLGAEKGGSSHSHVYDSNPAGDPGSVTTIRGDP